LLQNVTQGFTQVYFTAEPYSRTLFLAHMILLLKIRLAFVHFLHYETLL